MNDFLKTFFFVMFLIDCVRAIGFLCIYLVPLHSEKRVTMRITFNSRKPELLSLTHRI